MLDPSLINVTISPSILPHDQWCCIQFEKSVNQVLYTSWLKFQKNYESIEKQWSIQRFQSHPMETKNLIRIDNPISNTKKKKKSPGKAETVLYHGPFRRNTNKKFLWVECLIEEISNYFIRRTYQYRFLLWVTQIHYYACRSKMRACGWWGIKSSFMLTVLTFRLLDPSWRKRGGSLWL